MHMNMEIVKYIKLVNILMRKMKRKTRFLYVTFLMTFIIIFNISANYIKLKAQSQEEQYFFTIHVNLRPPYKEEYGVLLKTQLAKIGINLIPELLDSAGEEQRYLELSLHGKTFDEGGADLLSCSGVRVPPDPSVWMMRLWWTDSGTRGNDYGRTIFRFYNARLEGLVVEQSKTMNMTLRKEIFKKITELLYEESPYLPFYADSCAVPMSSNVENWFTPVGMQSVLWGLKMNDGSEQFTQAQGLDIMYLSGFYTGGDPGTHPLQYLIYDTLVRLDADGSGTLVPYLAKSWEVSPDNKVITFHLVEDATFHDGTPLTSEDVKFTMETHLDPNAATMYQSDVGNIEAIETPDNYTAVIYLKDADAAAVDKFTRIPICGKHLYEGIDPQDYRQSSENNIKCIGSGPYMFDTLKRGQYLSLVKNPNYWYKEMSIDTIILKIIPDMATALSALKSGEIDLVNSYYGVTVESRDFDNDERFTVLKFKATRNSGLAINCQHPILQNKWVRRAISTVILREEICNSLYGGWKIPATQYFTSDAWTYNEALPPLDGTIDQAKSYMERAGYNYEWLEQEPEPSINIWLYPLLGGLVVGAIAASGLTALVFRRKT